MSAKFVPFIVVYSFAVATSNGLDPETQTTFTVRAQKEELHLGDLKSLEQADQLRCHSHRSEDAERDESARPTTVRMPPKISGSVFRILWA